MAEEVRKSSDEMLLVRLRESWETHQREMRDVRDILMYMDRTYVPQSRKAPIYEQGTILFRTVVARNPDIKGRMLRLLLTAIEDGRRGRQIDNQLLRSVLGMLIDLGVSSTICYVEDFETRYLLDSNHFFQTESASLLETSTVPEYLRRTEVRLAQEIDRGISILHPSTLPRLKSLLERTMISEHAADLLELEGSGFISMLERDSREDLARMYSLFSLCKQPIIWTQGIGSGSHASASTGVTSLGGQGFDDSQPSQAAALSPTSDIPAEPATVGDADLSLATQNAPPSSVPFDLTLPSSSSSSSTSSSNSFTSPSSSSASASSSSFLSSAPRTRTLKPLDCMRETLKSHLLSLGRAIVADEAMMANPVHYIEKLLSLRQKYADIIWNSFSNDKEFMRTTKETFEMFLNSPNDRRPAEYLSLYVDEQMRIGFKDKSDDEINNSLNATVALFRYLQNKDEFEEWYKTHLQKRLLGNKTASDDAEKLMIVKLKSECGFQFTSKLEGMFNDLRVSQELMSRFRLYQQTSSASSSLSLTAQEACDIDVTVLTKVNWPGARHAPCPLPNEVKAAADSFSNYYLSHHTGRKIVWHTEKGTADVIFHTATKRFELTVSTWQMCVLSLFNDSAKSAVNFGEMTAALPGVPRDELQRHVLSLSTPKMRILVKNGKGKEIIDDDVFTINSAFESRLLKIKVPLVSMRSAVQSGATGASQSALAGGESGGAPGGGGGGISGGQAADEEGGDVAAQVENQRKNMIEASIVRIMKSRRTLDHANLVAEVTRQLGGRFKPTQQNIKKRIESLLEREYLERDKDDRRIYSYLA